MHSLKVEVLSLKELPISSSKALLEGQQSMILGCGDAGYHHDYHTSVAPLRYGPRLKLLAQCTKLLY